MWLCALRAFSLLKRMFDMLASSHALHTYVLACLRVWPICPPLVSKESSKSKSEMELDSLAN